MAISNTVDILNGWFYDLYIKRGFYPSGNLIKRRMLSFDAEVAALLDDYHNGLGSAKAVASDGLLPDRA